MTKKEHVRRILDNYWNMGVKLSKYEKGIKAKVDKAYRKAQKMFPNAQFPDSRALYGLFI